MVRLLSWSLRNVFTPSLPLLLAQLRPRSSIYRSNRTVQSFTKDYYVNSFSSFSYQRYPMVSHWSLRDSKSPQVSRTLFSNLADPPNTVICMVSTRPLFYKSFSPCTNILVTVARAPITISIIVTFMFHSFFQFPSKVPVFILLFTFFQSFNFTLWSAESLKSTIRQVLFFFVVDYYKVQGLAEMWWSVYISKSQRIVYVTLFRMRCTHTSGIVWHIPLVHMMKFQFLAQFPVD